MTARLSRTKAQEIPVTIIDVMSDPYLLGSMFGDESWSMWRVALKALFNLPLTAQEQKRAYQCTGRTRGFKEPVRLAWFIVGRRGGKSVIAAVVAVFLSCFRSYRLVPGERGVFMVIASDRRQARVVKGYVAALLQASPMLSAMIVRETKEHIELNNGITIEIHTASFRAIRGYTVVGAVMDEVAFWPTDDSANPDSEILHALTPAMATVPDALQLGISTPHSRRGELYKAWREHYGRDDSDVFVCVADTRTMNPTVPQALIDRAYADDESVAAAEYGAQFRRDLESFVSREAVEAVTVANRFELPHVAGEAYYGFLDPAGGSGSDSMTLAIAHQASDVAVLDATREIRPPFSPEQAAQELAALLRTYGVTTVQSDRWGGDWVREAFAKHGVSVEPADRPKADLYREFLPLLNSGRCELLDAPRLRSQLVGLERRVARGGRGSIDHGPGGHDDVANAVAGALVLAAEDDGQPSARMVKLAGFGAQDRMDAWWH